MRERNAAARGRRLRGFEDEILRIESEVPGFGGLHFDREAGQFVIHVRDSQWREAALAAVEGWVAPFGGRPGLTHFAGKEIEVRDAQFAFSELVAWSEVLVVPLTRVDGFVSIDADERVNRIVIQVADDAARREVAERVRQEGVPEGMARVELGPPVVLAVDGGSSALQSASLADRHRPAGGGVRTVRWDGQSACTLGWYVTTSQSESGFLTNAHCSYYGFGETGETMYQPTPGTSDTLGTVQINPEWNVDDCEDESQEDWEGWCAWADAMLISSGLGDFRVARGASLGYDDQPGSLTLAGWWESIYDPLYSVPELHAHKVGMTTGWTDGEITGTCLVVEVGTGFGPPAVIRCADRVEGSSVGHGDSGAPVFYAAAPGATLLPLGVLFAGNQGAQVCTSDCVYYFSPFHMIENHLLRTLSPKRVKVAVEIVGPDEVQEHQACSWDSSVSGGAPGSFSYEWRKDGVLVGQASSWSTADTGSGSFELELTVTDSESHTGFDELEVTVEGSGGFMCSG